MAYIQFDSTVAATGDSTSSEATSIASRQLCGAMRAESLTSSSFALILKSPSASHSGHLTSTPSCSRVLAIGECDRCGACATLASA